jgi:hypothetical protein
MAAKKKTAAPKASAPTKKTASSSNSGANIDRRKVTSAPANPKKDKVANPTKSTRIPGGALGSKEKISVYEYNDKTGREDLLGSVGRYDTSLGFGAEGGEWRFLRPSSKEYAMGYRPILVKNSVRNKAKTTPKGKK